jgi:hypothetical protein
MMPEMQCRNREGDDGNHGYHHTRCGRHRLQRVVCASTRYAECTN